MGTKTTLPIELLRDAEYAGNEHPQTLHWKRQCDEHVPPVIVLKLPIRPPGTVKVHRVFLTEKLHNDVEGIVP